jgi:hypothetical protein
MGNALVPIIMFGWIPVVLYLFARFPAQRAVVISFVIAWMFLPLADFKIPGIPIYDKMSATCYGILLATFIFDVERFKTFRLSWIDIPMVVWCLCPFATSLSNELGIYDGFSSTFGQIVTWGIPYFLGRIYLNDLAGLRQLAIAIFIGGLVYIPFCLFEMKFFQTVHGIVYGFSPALDWPVVVRYGVFRPIVFMTTGLMVGVWLMAAALIGLILWRTKVLKDLWNIPIGFLVGLLCLTLVLSRATGATYLLFIAIALLLVVKRFRTPILFWILIGYMGIYLSLGVSGDFPRKEIVQAVATVSDADRVSSLDFRFMNEEILSAKARQQLVFGWGGFGRNRVYDKEGRDITVTDSLWIIAFGIYGVVGLVSLFSALLVPVIGFCTRFPTKLWFHPQLAPATAIATGLMMYAYDCVVNAMVNPIFTLAAGGIAGLVVSEGQTISQRVRFNRLPPQPRPEEVEA